MLIVRGAVKDYDWGIVDGLVQWSGSATGGPQAELWFGVHPGGPSPLVDSLGQPTGGHLADYFDIEAIPLLVKLLAAARPLSVQVHPSKAVARAGWAAQERGTDEPVFSDPFEKTEMLVALGPFEAFAGWRSPAEAVAMLAHLPGTGAAVAALEVNDIMTAVTRLLEAAAPEAVAMLPEAAQLAGLDDDQCRAYATVAEQYPDDPGAMITPLLAYLRLTEGQGVYLPAGVPHSYIRGTGLEVMTSSDNVIRLGLTSKPVFVDRALEALRLDLAPQFMATTHGDLIWPVNSPFVVRMLESGRERIPAGAYRILLIVEGTAHVETELAEMSLRPGTAAVLASEDPDVFIEVDGLVAIIQSTER